MEPEPEPGRQQQAADAALDALPDSGEHRAEKSGLRAMIKEMGTRPDNIAEYDDEADVLDPALAEQDTAIRVPLGSPQEKELLDEMRGHLAGTGLEDPQADQFWLLACLRARKFDAERGATLFKRYMAWRVEFQVDELGHPSHPRMQEFFRLKVTRFTGGRDKVGRLIIQGTARNQRPDIFQPDDVLRGMHAILEAALRAHPDAQARGISMVYDVGGAGLSNMDPKLSKKLAPAFSANLPIRIGRMNLVNPPWFIKILFPIFRSFMSKKLQSRMRIVGAYEGLHDEIDPAELLPETGGTRVFDHEGFSERMSFGSVPDVVRLTGREEALTFRELAVLVCVQGVAAEAKIFAAGMVEGGKALGELVDMETVEDCEADDVEELSAALAESMWAAGARTAALLAFRAQ